MRLPRFTHDTWHWMYLFPVTFVVAMFAIVMWDTHTAPEPPFLGVESSIGTMIRTPCSVDIHYQRDYTVARHFVGKIQRSFIHQKTGLIVDVPSVSRIFTPGRYTAPRALSLPSAIADGEYILRTYVIWTPRMSIREHWWQFPDIPITLTTYHPSGEVIKRK